MSPAVSPDARPAVCGPSAALVGRAGVARCDLPASGAEPALSLDPCIVAPYDGQLVACFSDPDQPVTHIVLERDLGSLRIPPLVVFIASSILFGLSLLGLHWRERDLEDAKRAAEAEAADAEAAKKSPATREPEPEPANA